MDGSAFFKGRREPDPEHESAVYQASQDEWNDRLKEKNTQIKLACGVAGVLAVLLGGSIYGNIYLGTLPKQTVDYVMLDKQFSPVYSFNSKNLPPVDVMAARKDRLETFIRNLYGVRPDKQGMFEQLKEAFLMTLPDSPGRAQGTRFVDETKPYKRGETEVAYVDIGSLNPGAPNEWHVTFTVRVTDLRGTPKSEKTYTGVMTTRVVPGLAEKVNPLDLFVYDWSFDAKEGAK